MIRVTPAPEPASFDGHVRQRGAAAVARLLGQAVGGRGRRPAKTYARPEDIPADRFPARWTEARKSDGESALDDLMSAYGQFCAYLGLYLERATGSPTVDHYVPKQRNWQLVYEWSNYRLSASGVNGAKGLVDVVDPFAVQPGWFELDLATFFVQAGALVSGLPEVERMRIERTLPMLNLRQCVKQRGEYITLYRRGEIDWREVERRAPFIAYEMRRQGAS